MQKCPTSPLSVDGLPVNDAKQHQKEPNNNVWHQLSKVSNYADFTGVEAQVLKRLRVKLVPAHRTPPMGMKHENFVQNEQKNLKK